MITRPPSLAVLPLREGKRPSAHPAIVRVEGLTKRFPRRRSWSEILHSPWRRPPPATAVDHVSFAVRTGELFGLLGPNGAGKTTLFKILGTQLLPDEGRAEIGGLDVVRLPSRIRRILTPVVADERSLYWRLSAADNLELFAAMQGCPRRGTSARVRKVLAIVDLQDVGAKMVGTFSSGMKQRLLIARALLARPKVLLLDEPTRSLDPLAARAFRRFLREEIVGRQGCTVLLATHNAEEAFELCDRVAVLDGGRLLALGPLRELMGHRSENTYRVAVRSSHRKGMLRIGRARLESEVRIVGETSDGDWTEFELRIPGGPGGSAGLLTDLIRAGIDVSRFERVERSLADLLEAVVSQAVGRSLA